MLFRSDRRHQHQRRGAQGVSQGVQDHGPRHRAGGHRGVSRRSRRRFADALPGRARRSRRRAERRLHAVRREHRRGADLRRPAGAGRGPAQRERGRAIQLREVGHGGDEQPHAAVAAEIPAQHAGVPRDDRPRRRGAEQHDHLRRSQQSPRDRRGVPHGFARRGGRMHLRRRGEQGQPDGPAAAGARRPAEHAERRAGAGVSPLRGQSRRHGCVGRRRAGDSRSAGACAAARGTHLRGGRRFRGRTRRPRGNATQPATPGGPRDRRGDSRRCATRGSRRTR